MFNKKNILFLLLMLSFLCGTIEPIYAQDSTNTDSEVNAKNDTTNVVDTENNSSGDNKISDNKSETRTTIERVGNILSFGAIFGTAVTLIFTWLFILLLVRILDNLSEKSASYRLFIKRLVPFVRIVVWTLSIYFIIQGIIQPPIQTIVTVMASVGIAVGFASQDILKNIFGGIMIILDRPFQVGDKIDIGGHYGEVIQIGLRSVRLVTPDDSVVSVPNGELMNQSVSNANSGALDCQVVSEVYLPIGVDIVEVKKIAWQAAVTSKYVYLNKPVSVIIKNVVEARESFIKLRIKAYVLDIRFEFPFMSEMTEIFLQECISRSLLDKSKHYNSKPNQLA